MPPSRATRTSGVKLVPPMPDPSKKGRHAAGAEEDEDEEPAGFGSRMLSGLSRLANAALEAVSPSKAADVEEEAEEVEPGPLQTPKRPVRKAASVASALAASKARSRASGQKPAASEPAKQPGHSLFSGVDSLPPLMQLGAATGKENADGAHLSSRTPAKKSPAAAKAVPPASRAKGGAEKEPPAPAQVDPTAEIAVLQHMIATQPAAVGDLVRPRLADLLRQQKSQLPR